MGCSLSEARARREPVRRVVAAKFRRKLVCSSSLQICLRGHAPPARFRLIVIRILRSVDNGDAGENILHTESATPPVPVRDRRILLPATLAWMSFVPVEFGVSDVLSVMPG